MKLWSVIPKDYKKFSHVLPVDKDYNNKKLMDEWFEIAGKPVKNTYNPIEMKRQYKSKKMCNIPYFFSNLLIFDDVTLNFMSELLKEANVEILPINCVEKNLYVINILDNFAVDEVLDLAKSKFEYFDNSDKVMYVKKYVFKESAVLKKDIFSVYGEIMVSDKFKQIVENNKLTGIEFHLKWDSEINY